MAYIPISIKHDYLIPKSVLGTYVHTDTPQTFTSLKNKELTSYIAHPKWVVHRKRVLTLIPEYNETY